MHAFRGETQRVKDRITIVTTRKHLPLTLALKHQLRLNHRLLNNISFTDEIISGPHISIDSMYSHPQFDSFKKYLPQIYTTVSWIEVQSILFKPQFVLSVDVTDILPVFGLIHFICLNEAKEPFFVLQILETLGFSIYMLIVFRFQVNGRL